MFSSIKPQSDTKEYFMCHSISIHDSIQCVTGTQPSEQPATL